MEVLTLTQEPGQGSSRMGFFSPTTPEFLPPFALENMAACVLTPFDLFRCECFLFPPLLSSRMGSAPVILVVVHFPMTEHDSEYWMYLAAIFLNGNNLIATANNYRPSRRIKHTIAEKGQACISEMSEK